MNEVKTVTVDGIEYLVSNKRMRYNPEFHENHFKPFTKEELIYMCSMWDSTTKANLAMALGRTPGAILSRGYCLRRNGKFDYYKNLGQEEF